MKKFLNTMECTDSISDDVSTDTSSTHSSYQDSSAFEDAVSAFDCEENNNKCVKDTESSAVCEADSAQQTSAAQPAAADSGSFFNNKDKLFRNDYINKLTNMKIIRPQAKSKTHQTLAIFDWDDTLFPTTFLSGYGFDKVRSESKLQVLLSKIDKCVSRLLQKAVRCGRTCIITNATENWVETSSRRYLPQTYAFLRKNDITIISARAKYERRFPNEPKRWKHEAFMDLKESLEGTLAANIICIGDSTLELEAAKHICKMINQAILKTIKFKEAPRVEELLKQQEVVVEKFDQIYMTLRSLTITVAKKN